MSSAGCWRRETLCVLEWRRRQKVNNHFNVLFVIDMAEWCSTPSDVTDFSSASTDRNFHWNKTETIDAVIFSFSTRK